MDQEVFDEIQQRCERVKSRRNPLLERFRDELVSTFDENGLADSLEVFATRCDRVRALFLAGDPIDDLPDSARLAEATVSLYRALSSDRAKVTEIETALLFMAQFSRYKALGIIARLSGRIKSATRYEDSAEACYNRLGRDWRW